MLALFKSIQPFMRTHFYYAIIALFAMTCLSCSDRQPCDTHIYDAYLCFELVDAQNNFLIAAWGAKYDSDSTYFISSNGDLIVNSANSSTNICFSLTKVDYEEAVDTAVEQVYYLYLPDQNGHPKADKDTVRVRYGAFITSNITCVDSLQVWYNDSLYHSGGFKSYFAFLKK